MAKITVLDETGLPSRGDLKANALLAALLGIKPVQPC